VLAALLCRAVVVVFRIPDRYARSKAFKTRDASTLSVGLHLLRPGLVLFLVTLFGAALAWLLGV